MRNKLDPAKEAALRARIEKVRYRGFLNDLHEHTRLNYRHLCTIISGKSRRFTPTTYVLVEGFVEKLEKKKA